MEVENKLSIDRGCFVSRLKFFTNTRIIRGVEFPSVETSGLRRILQTADAIGSEVVYDD